jgi:hypothetical protein
MRSDTPRRSLQRSPEGAQAASLLQYLALLLAARCLEALTGLRGILTFVYLAIFAQNVLHWLATGVPTPAEARARVQALEAGLPYLPAPGEAAHAAYRLCFPEAAAAATEAETLLHGARAVASEERGAAGTADVAAEGWAFLTTSRLLFLEDYGGEGSSGGPRLRVSLPFAGCTAVERAPEADAPPGALRLLRGAAAPPLRLSPAPPQPQQPPQRGRPVSLHDAVHGYWRKATASPDAA